MKKGNFITSFNHAVQGIISSIHTERNMKFHYFAAIAVILGSLFMNLNRLEFMMLFISVTFVLMSELINTAIERTVDLITQTYNPVAKLAKDIAAGAVLISAVNAAVVGYLLFFERFTKESDRILVKIRNSSPHLTFVALLLVLLFIIGGKLLGMKRSGGTFFQGGAISGHSALSFCMATIVSLIAMNGLVTTLSFGLAFLVAESRVEGKIHKTREVILGGILGILVAILVFRIVG